jgi:hypoxanthine phosphoribosyltransferase
MTGADDLEIFIDEQAIEQQVRDLAAQISRDYAGKELLLVCILKGAAIFAADLARRLAIPARMDFVQVSSYGRGTVPSRALTLAKDVDTDIRGMHVLLVDGIIDTGGTLDLLLNRLRQAGPASLKTTVLLDKHSRRTKDVQVDYRGFEIPDRFVVGYGMDYGEKYRNLPYIAVIEQK